MRNVAIYVGHEPLPLESIPPGCWLEYEPNRGWFLLCPEDWK